MLSDDIRKQMDTVDKGLDATKSKAVTCRLSDFQHGQLEKISVRLEMSKTSCAELLLGSAIKDAESVVWPAEEALASVVNHGGKK